MSLSQFFRAFKLGKAADEPEILYPLLLGIGWTDSRDEANSKLEAAGCKLAGEDGVDFSFFGTLYGYEGEGWVYMAGDVVTKVLFVVYPTKTDVLNVYERIRRMMLEDFGPTKSTVDFVEAPFYRGDGRTIEALAQNKGAIATAWNSEPKDGNAGVVLRVSNDARIRISAESPGWEAEVRRRSATP